MNAFFKTFFASLLAFVVGGIFFVVLGVMFVVGIHYLFPNYSQRS